MFPCPRITKRRGWVNAHLSCLLATAILHVILLLDHSQISLGLASQFKGDTSFFEVVHPRSVEDATSRRYRRMSDRPRSPATRQYIFRTSEKTFRLNLIPNDKLISPDFVVERRYSSNISESDIRSGYRRHRGCSYRGRVEGRRESHVAVNICRGLSGVISVDEDIYFIEPVNATDNEHGVDGHPHAFYKPAAVINDDSTLSDGQWPRPSLKHNLRRRRSTSRERTVETLVVVDQSMIAYYKDQNIETYVLTIINMVANFYRDPSIGNSINVVVVRLIFLENGNEFEMSRDADTLLDNFCAYQEKINPKGDGHPLHFDNAILLTRVNLCQATCRTLGLAHVAGMCHPSRSCSINQDNGLSVAYTVAHEMGHNFGMQHDGFKNVCPSFNDVSPHLMSSRVLEGGKSITWSTCSRDYITQFLNSGKGQCLDDNPSPSQNTLPPILPGVMYTADHQCRLQYGPNSTVCPMFESDVCITLWCSYGIMCRSRNSPAAQGTGCGKDKWCISGACVDVEEQPEVISGGWGPWGEWSPCSLTCGRGIRSRERKCDNPRPSNGGKYCIGERQIYSLCTIQACLPGSASVRATQCSAFNTQEFDGVTYEWTPVYIQDAPCELYCRSRTDSRPERLSARVLDGSPCSRFSTDICINGICQSVGCDNRVNSGAVADRCGVCHGDGSSCQTIRGNFTKPHGQGTEYEDVILIPAGARHVDVKETEGAGNYLAIRNTAGTFLLNGGYVIEWSGEYEAAGTIISYERVGDTERIEAQGPLTEPLHIVLLFLAKNEGLTYEYTVPTSNADEAAVMRAQSFSWTFSDWSSCSRSCGTGYQRASAICVEQTAGRVDDRYCGEPKPEDMQQTCNHNQCPAVWWEGPWQLCSGSCGVKGRRKQRSVFCIRGMSNREQIILEDSDCLNQGQGKPVTEESCQELLPCVTTGSWQTGEWSQCSVTCGEGWHTRSVTCALTDGRDGWCDEQYKPSERHTCFHEECRIPPPTFDYSAISASEESDSSVGESAADSTSYSSASEHPLVFGEWVKKKVAIKKHDAANDSSESSGFDENLDSPVKILITTHDIPSIDDVYEGGRELQPSGNTFSFTAEDVFSESESSGKQEAFVGGGTQDQQQMPAYATLEWHAHEWQACLGSCEQSVQQRVVECIDTRSGMTSSGCDTQNQPPSSQLCTNESCPAVCQDTLTITMCAHVAQSGQCRTAHFREACCVTCSHHR